MPRASSRPGAALTSTPGVPESSRNSGAVMPTSARRGVVASRLLSQENSPQAPTRPTMMMTREKMMALLRAAVRTSWAATVRMMVARE